MKMAIDCEHGVTEARRTALRAIAGERMGDHVGTCACCEGPSGMASVAGREGEPLQWVAMPFCRVCDGGLSYVEQAQRAWGYMLPGAWADRDGKVYRRGAFEAAA